VREVVTTALDTLGLLLLAAGATGAAWRLIGPAALAAGGVVVLAGSWWFAKPPRPKRRRKGEVA
jgi:hypothetical protein